MNRFVASAALVAAALLPAAALAADPVTFDYPVYKDYVPPVIPPVDEGLQGSFYLRGSVAGNLAWAREVDHPTEPGSPFAIDEFGYGYSAGLGVGFESGDGLRFDVTVDHLQNDGMSAVITGPGPVTDGRHDLHLRSTIVLANAYYDFGLGDFGLSAAGGMFGYVGGGVGVAFNRMGNVEPGASVATNWGSNTSLAAAGMVGVGYDFGALVADLGYRGLYINHIENNDAPNPYSIDNALIHELRATLRYRF